MQTVQKTKINETLKKGDEYMQKHMPKEALNEYLKTLFSEKRNPKSYLGVSRAYKELKEYDKAIKHLEKAKNIGYFNLAKYHYRQNEKSITNVFDINLEKDFDVFLKEVKKYIEKYKKEKKFLDTYYITILTKQIKLIEIYLSFGKFKEFENLINNNKYLEELKKVRKEKLNIYQKLMLKQIKNKNEKMIKKVFKIKKIIKNI